MRYSTVSLSLLAFAAACAGGSRPAASPAPTPAGKEVPAIAADSSPTQTAAPKVEPPAKDSAKDSAKDLTLADLDRRTAELFGEAIKPDATLAPPVDSTPVVLDNGPTWDIDVRSYETVDRVRHYVQAFTGGARRRFVDRLERGTQYEAMIREKLRAGDVPEDMYYLALVESGYNPHAYSTAAAVGMWQFMTTTGKGLGLRIDWWVDERRDPVRSTEAAVRFLAYLREQFGSMYLAAAAYNGGPGRVARGLSQYADDLDGATGDDMFFALAEKNYLRTETREYVPQLIAAALIAKEPARYGITIEPRPALAFDTAKLGPRVPLAAIAKASGTTVERVQALNPHILRGMTPPKDSFTVRLPAGSRARFDSAFARLKPEAKLGAKSVTTKPGATWSSLAFRSGVSARNVSTWNPTVKASKWNGVVATGTRVIVPTPAVVAAALTVPNPAIERYGGSGRTHVVRKGENLSVIAKRYGTTSSALMRLNRLKKPLIFPGQELLVRGRSTPSRPAPRRTGSKD